MTAVLPNDSPSLRQPVPQGAASGLRTDIEGMRALAILGVLLFHFDLAGARGGFAGVDIFFVISGYLITSILGQRTDFAGRDAWLFAIKRFWRIAPAYYAVVLVTLAATAIWFLGVDIRDAAKSGIAAGFFVSNIYYNNGAGYFEGPAIYKPLLHTWSLAVEIQFYILWPLLFWLTRARPERRQMLVIVLGIASFAACLLLSITDEKFAFYMLPTRLWEFCAGAYVAQRLMKPDAGSSTPPPAWTGGLALAVVTASPWLVSEHWIWPAPGAVIPVAATAWLLLAPGAVAAPLLSSPPLRFIGRISYSLYLVHWPLAVFINYLLPPEPELIWRLAGFVLSWPLAAALYAVLEKPARRIGKLSVRPLIPVRALQAAPIAVLAAGLAMPALLARTDDRDMESNICPRKMLFAGAERCVLGDVQAVPDVLLWGDSHARHFSAGFDELMRKTQRAAILLTVNGCLPATDVRHVARSLRLARDCDALNKQIISILQRDPGRWDVYIAARWNFYGSVPNTLRAKISRLLRPGGQEAARIAQSGHPNTAAAIEDVITSIEKFAARITLIEQVPEFKFDVRHCGDILAVRGVDQARCSVARDEIFAKYQEIAALLHAVGQRHASVRFLDPKSLLCAGQRCAAKIGGTFVYRDSNHITDESARELIQAFAGAIAR